MGTNKKLQHWANLYERAHAQYTDQLDKMPGREALYAGTKQIQPAPGKPWAKDATSVRNIVYELVESQVDSALPTPKVEALHAEDAELAKKVEALLQGQMLRLRAEEFNDLDERVTYTQGGDFAAVEWNPRTGMHCSLGALELTQLHPRRVIPQPGMIDLEKMDYFFVLSARTRQSLQREYGVQLQVTAESEASIRDSALEPAQPSEEMVTVITAWYRGKRGRVGKFSWVASTILEDCPEYEEKQTEVCKNCGTPRGMTDECTACGGTEFAYRALDMELLPGTHTLVPAYHMDLYPVVLRRNVSRPGALLGASDVDNVRDQQEAIKKLGTKIDEKILKGGSLVTLPEGTDVETSDREMKIVYLRSPAEKALISALNLQPDVAGERMALEENYNWAKSTLGITDAYQGKYDASAQSGTAKKISAGQAAGRLESKRVMKNAFWSAMFERMFKTWLAFSADPEILRREGTDGTEYETLSRWEFLKWDAAGQPYFCDEFLFTIDTASITAYNRQALWEDAKANYAAGAFGPADQLESQMRYWKLLDKLHYPSAKEMLTMLKAREGESGLPMQENPLGAGAEMGTALPNLYGAM